MRHTINFFVAAIVLVATSCGSSGEEVNVYSGRHYRTDEALFAEFTQQTGIRVNLIKANSDQLINRLQMEGKRSPADLIITADAGRLILAREMGLLQPFESDKIKEIVPSHFRDDEDFWTGFTKRARVIVYHKERVNPSELDGYEQLADPKWEGRILVRSSQNHYNQTLMASVIAALGTDSATQWGHKLVANMAQTPRGNDRDQVKAIAAGVGDIAIANTYYIGLMLNSSNAEEREVAAKTGIHFPNQNGRGTHVNISGVGIAANARNYDNANKLIEFLLEKHAQSLFAEENFEYPINPNVEWPVLLKEWGTFKADTLPLHKLGQHLHEAMIIFNNVGWE